MGVCTNIENDARNSGYNLSPSKIPGRFKRPDSPRVRYARDYEKRLRWLTDLASSWRILEISSETARHYADIRHALKQQATPIPSNDTWIAALAREHVLPILTNDTHFDSVPGIDRISF